MKHGNLIFVALISALISACASHQAITDAKSKSIPTLKASPVAKVPPVKESPPAKDSMSTKGNNVEEHSLVNPNIVGLPLPGGKFAKLKIGMSMKQVEELIGAPDRQWQQSTGEDSTPYYSGTDRLLVQYAYRSEGMLTFNLSSEHLLIRILVNRAE